MTDLITKLNTAIAVLGDAKKSLEKQRNMSVVGKYTPDQLREYWLPKEDSKESIMRRLVVVRGMLNEINRELRGK